MPAVWPFNSKALITSRKSPLLPKHTSHTFTSGVKPHDATNLGRRKSETGYLLQICYFGWATELYSHSHTELSSEGGRGHLQSYRVPRRGTHKGGLCEVNPIWTPTFRTLL